MEPVLVLWIRFDQTAEDDFKKNSCSNLNMYLKKLMTKVWKNSHSNVFLSSLFSWTWSTVELCAFFEKFQKFQKQSFSVSFLRIFGLLFKTIFTVQNHLKYCQICLVVLWKHWIKPTCYVPLRADLINIWKYCRKGWTFKISFPKKTNEKCQSGHAVNCNVLKHCKGKKPLLPTWTSWCEYKLIIEKN